MKSFDVHGDGLIMTMMVDVVAALSFEMRLGSENICCWLRYVIIHEGAE